MFPLKTCPDGRRTKGIAIKNSRQAQTFVFFLLAFGTIFLLCGLAIDSGLLYLAKARLSRAVDGAALAAVGNFHQSDDPATNRTAVATTMKDFAIVNYADLNPISDPISFLTQSSTPYTQTNGQPGTIYTYTFSDNQTDSTGNYRRYVQVVLLTGSGGQITTATCNARCPVHTYFMGYAGAFFRDMKVSSSAIATRNPRLIMVVIDRSGSMLDTGGGAYGLPNAIVTFLNFFDTSSDYIGIVSFSSNARLEMALTTNFLTAGTNVLYNSYQIDPDENAGIPALDPEEVSDPSNYATATGINGVRRLKFGGLTAADEGMRMALEQLMANSGFNNPDVVKYMVLFTDGAWNNARTLLAAPGYTNIVLGPPLPNSLVIPKIQVVSATNLTAAIASGSNTNLATIPIPSMSPFPDETNALADPPSPDYQAAHHANDTWLSQDGKYEPVPTSPSLLVGAPQTVYGTNRLSTTSTNIVYTTSLDVWLQPGAVDYVYGPGGILLNRYVSNFNNPTQRVDVELYNGYSNVLIVPGYIVDGLFSDELDMDYPDSASYPNFRNDNYHQAFMWPDDPAPSGGGTYLSTSVERMMMFRNYVNLLTGYYIFRPDDPLSTQTNTLTGAVRPLNGLGPYYPSAGFYFPFDLVGVNPGPTRMLKVPTIDPDTTHEGLARKASWSINMLSVAATPEWAGEVFYEGTNATPTDPLAAYTGLSDTGAASTMITTVAGWQDSIPDWALLPFANNMTTNSYGLTDTNIVPNPVAWRPYSFNGSNTANGSFTDINDIRQTDPLNVTGGYVTDGNGNYFRNAMAYSGRPTHFFNFATSKWQRFTDNHDQDSIALAMGNWKVQEYAWHARALGVTIFTVGYGQDVSPAEQVLLAQVANATNTTAGNNQGPPYIPTNSAGVLLPGTGINFNPKQPIGQQFYANTANDISNDFYQVGTVINAALTQ